MSVSAATASCSGIFTVEAAVGGTTTGNLTQIVIPPQILLQVMYSEAHGQSAQYGSADLSEQAIGVTIRNRFGDSQWFRGSTTYQNSITPAQFRNLNSTLTTGSDAQGMPTAELTNAAAVYGGSSTVSVGNAKCFFSPNAVDWLRLQTALAKGTLIRPTITKVNEPGCFAIHRQYVYKASISTNINGSGAPAFIFEQWRNLTDPAVIQIP
jgi:hypothetical protein